MLDGVARRLCIFLLVAAIMMLLNRTVTVASALRVGLNMRGLLGTNTMVRPAPVLQACQALSCSTTQSFSPSTIPVTGLIRKKLKVRQHVNPLSEKFQRPIPLETNWVSSAYASLQAEQFVVDVGSAKGSWALEMCKKNANINVLGLEIRKALVDNCLERKAKWNLTNVHYLSCNANVDIKRILHDLTTSGVTVNMVTIQFPDPMYKEKHKKRRLVNPAFVRDVASGLSPGASVFMKSDVLDLMEDMVSHFRSSPYFEIDADCDPVHWQVNTSPFPIQTEREVATLGHGLPVYRMLFHRTDMVVEPSS